MLFPKLVSGGILHIDDYGMCPGVRNAVDEYFINKKIWLHRVDFTCRLMIIVISFIYWLPFQLGITLERDTFYE